MSVIQRQTHIKCDGCGAHAPPAVGVVLARQLARQLEWRADGSSRPDLCPNCLAIEEYRRLIKRIGPGFHPDTPFDGYEPPLDNKMSAMYYRRTIDRVFIIPGYDPYGDTLDLIHEMMEKRA
jgi:hypothetical protein